MAVAGVVSAPVHADVGGSIAYGYWDVDGGDSTMGGVIVLNGSGEATTNGGSTVYGNVSLSSSGQELGNWGGSMGLTGVVVGIKGDFGNVSLGDGGSGAHLGQLAGDRWDVTDGARYRHAIGYTNSFEGITFRVTSDPSSDDATTPLVDESGVNSFGLQGTFGGVTVGFGQEDDDSVIGASMSFGDIGLAIHQVSWDATDDTSLAIKVSYSAGAVSASYVTDTMDDADITKSQLDVSYDLGGGAAIKLRNRAADVGGGTEYTRILLSVGF